MAQKYKLKPYYNFIIPSFNISLELISDSILIVEYEEENRKKIQRIEYKHECDSLQEKACLLIVKKTNEDFDGIIHFCNGDSLVMSKNEIFHLYKREGIVLLHFVKDLY